MQQKDKPILELETIYEAHLMEMVLQQEGIPYRTEPVFGLSGGEYRFRHGWERFYGRLWGFAADEPRIRALYEQAKATQPGEEESGMADA